MFRSVTNFYAGYHLPNITLLYPRLGPAVKLDDVPSTNFIAYIFKINSNYYRGYYVHLGFPHNDML